jgi:hypothetical protein
MFSEISSFTGGGPFRVTVLFVTLVLLVVINNTNCPTFHHHNGKSNSQIDYILENIQSNILIDTKIEEQHQLKGSAHVPRW